MPHALLFLSQSRLKKLEKPVLDFSGSMHRGSHRHDFTFPTTGSTNVRSRPNKMSICYYLIAILGQKEVLKTIESATFVFLPLLFVCSWHMFTEQGTRYISTRNSNEENPANVTESIYSERKVRRGKCWMNKRMNKTAGWKVVIENWQKAKKKESKVTT